MTIKNRQGFKKTLAMLMALLMLISTTFASAGPIPEANSLQTQGAQGALVTSPVKNDDGTYTFNVAKEGSPYNAQKGPLYLIGSFVGWDESKQVALLDQGNGYLSTTVDFATYGLVAGDSDINIEYKFKYGSWNDGGDFIDPLNPRTNGNASNSLLVIPKLGAPQPLLASPVKNDDGTYTFNVAKEGSPYNPQKGPLYLIGSFIGWDESKQIEMVDQGKGYLSASVDFAALGLVANDSDINIEYKFKYGSWNDGGDFIDPLNPQTSNHNSLITLAKVVGETPVLASPVNNNNGTYTFNVALTDANYDATKGALYVIGDFVGWDQSKQIELVNTGKGYLSATVDFEALGKSNTVVQYKFKYATWDLGNFVDTLNPSQSNGNSLLEIGAPVNTLTYHLTGSFQGWNAGNDDYTMQDADGDGIYEITLNLAAQRYEFKVTKKQKGAITWVPDGTNNNHVIDLKKPEAVTFYFNAKLFEAGDHSHPISTSKDMQLFAYVSLVDATTQAVLGQMKDPDFDGIYTLAFNKLEKGTYKFALQDPSGVALAPLATPYEVTLGEDFNLELAYNSGYDYLTDNYAQTLDGQIDGAALGHNSWQAQYRQPFGAVTEGSLVKLSLATKKGDASKVTLMLDGKPLKMALATNENAELKAGYDLYERSVKLDQIGVSKYYFVVQDGESRLYYGGSTGLGQASVNIPENYGITVHAADYQTPDWMKLSVTYQIFGDRFYNGNPANDKVKQYGMGSIPLQFPKWDQYAGFEDTRYQFVNPDLYANIAAEMGYTWDQDWHNDMYGGDIAGVRAKLDYLQDLGIKTIYFNPIFESISAHKYDSADYSQLDPRFGSNTDFEMLAQEARARGMNIILDGVFNHVGSDSKYFNKYGKNYEDHVLGAYEAWMLTEKKAGNPVAEAYYAQLVDKSTLSVGNYTQTVDKPVDNGDNFRNSDFYAPYLNGEKEITSPYSSWFVIKNDGTYEGWWGYDSLPVIQSLNGSELNVTSFADYIIENDDSIARQWIERGSSGWRLDVSPEVSADFWQQLRKYIKGTEKGDLEWSNGEPIILAENWGDATQDFLSGAFDSTMNYRFRQAAIEFVINQTTYSKFKDNGLDAEETWNPADAAAVNNQLMFYLEKYPKESSYVLMNLLGSHDVPRIMGILGYVEVDRPLYPATIKDIAGQMGLDMAAVNAKIKEIAYVSDFVKLGLTTQGALKTYLDKRNEEARQRYMLATTLQMTYPGSPTVYYGDEVGMSGYHDPDNRRAFNWSLATPQNDVLAFTSKLARLRNENMALQTGTFVPMSAELGSEVYAYARVLSGEEDAVGNRVYTTNYSTNETKVVAQNNGLALVALNKGTDANKLTLSLSDLATNDAKGLAPLLANGKWFKDGISGAYYQVQNDKLELNIKAQSAMVLLPSGRPIVNRNEDLDQDDQGLEEPKTPLLEQLEDPTTAKGALNFSDLKGFEWAEPMLALLIQKGIISPTGTGSGQFEPSRPITRAEMAAMMVRLIGALNLELPATTRPLIFTDTPQQSWYALALRQVYTLGLMKGVDKATFAPNAKVTMETALTLAGRLLKLKGHSLDRASSELYKLLPPSMKIRYSTISPWAKESFLLCWQAGLFDEGPAHLVKNLNAAPWQSALDRISAAELMAWILK